MRALRVLVLISFLVASVSCLSSGERMERRTLHLFSSEKITTLDPATVEDIYSAREIGKVYEGLYQYHFLKRPYSIIPNLAVAMPEVSVDGGKVTIRLKQGVRFADDPCFQKRGGKGRDVVAADFVYSLKRIADPRLKSSGWKVIDGKIEGLNAWREDAIKNNYADYSRSVEGLQAIDAQTFELRLLRPFRDLLEVLATPSFFVVAREAVEYYGSRFDQRPVGTGPFQLDREVSFFDQKLIWTKNPTFRREQYPFDGEAIEDQGKVLPLVERVEVSVVQDSQEQWKRLQSGKADLIELPKTQNIGVITPKKELEFQWRDKGFKLYKEGPSDVAFISFNFARPILSQNRLLRQALSLAIEAEPMIDLFYGGRAVPAFGPIPPGFADADPSISSSFRKFDLARAKGLLAKAGYPNGTGLPTLEYLGFARHGSKEGERDPLSEYVRRSLEALGVRVKLIEMDWKGFHQAVKTQKGHLWGGIWNFDYPSSENVLALFYSKNIDTRMNESGYRNPAYDLQFEKYQSTSGEIERRKIAQEMVKLLIEDCPWIWTVHRIRYRIGGPRLRNYRSNEFDFGYVKYLGLKD